MIRRSRLRVATFATLAAALLLAGCGRKGPLDPPPGGWDVPTSRMVPASNKPAEPAPVQYDTEGKPIAPSGLKRPMPMDVLLN